MSNTKKKPSITKKQENPDKDSIKTEENPKNSRPSKELPINVIEKPIKDEKEPVIISKSVLKLKGKFSILEDSGLFQAYEGLLRNLCQNGLPIGDIYEYAAVHILKFEKKMKQKERKLKRMSRSMEKISKIMLFSSQIFMFF